MIVSLTAFGDPETVLETPKWCRLITDVGSRSAESRVDAITATESADDETVSAALDDDDELKFDDVIELVIGGGGGGGETCGRS